MPEHVLTRDATAIEATGDKGGFAASDLQRYDDMRTIRCAWRRRGHDGRSR
jgi:hypothetical protein